MVTGDKGTIYSPPPSRGGLGERGLVTTKHSSEE